jgi:hypothetical protein
MSLKGDVVLDYRLIDYLACLLSTRTSGALDGMLGNDLKLKNDLTSMGTFHAAMPLYLLYRQRRYEEMGFSGFEGRHYSQFASFQTDLGQAATLQVLLSALAFQYIFREGIGHADIPDTPRIESERRQIFFGTAIGIPTFYVHRQSRNRFLRTILKDVRETRMSRRYAGYIRVKTDEYKRALVRMIRRDAAELVEQFHAEACLTDLEERLQPGGEKSAAGRLAQGILSEAGARSPLQLSAGEFSQAAERFYRQALRRQLMEEGLDAFEKDLAGIDTPGTWRQGRYNRPLFQLLKGVAANEYLARHRQAILFEMASEDILEKLIHLFILVTLRARRAEATPSPADAGNL